MRKARGFWGAVGLFIGLLIVAIIAAPRVDEFHPSSESPHVPASAPVRIRFDRPMDRVSVESRLSIDPPVPGQFSWEGETLIFRPAQPWSAGTSVEVVLAPGARSSLFLPLLRSVSWSFEVGQPRLIYLWPADKAADLYLYDLASDEIQRLTQTEAGVLNYSVAAGSVIYAALRQDGSSVLRSLDLGTGEDQVLLECPASHRCRSPVVDPSGEWLAYERFEWRPSESGQRVPGPSRVWLMALRRHDEPAPIAPAGQSLETPSWSPAGVLAYYNATLQAVGLVRPDDGSPPDLIPNGLGLLGSWSPDGRYLILPEIVFPEAEQASPVEFYSHLFRVDTLSTAVTELSQGSVEDASPSYSPDGEWIAFARKYLDQRWTPGRQLWLMRSDGTQPRRLTDQPDFSHASISWSPDSSALVYMQRSQTGSNLAPQIWMMDLNLEQPRLLVEGGYLPKWLP